jgi:hypothetical protein
MDTAFLIFAVLLAGVLICVRISTRRHRRQLRKHMMSLSLQMPPSTLQLTWIGLLA